MDVATYATWRMSDVGPVAVRRLVFLAAVVSASVGVAADIPLSVVQPLRVVAYSPGFAPANSSAQLPDGITYTSLRLPSQGRVSYAIPAKQASFQTTLYRSDTSVHDLSGKPVPDINRIQVRFIVDDKVVQGSVLESTTPPAHVVIPLRDGKILTIEVEQQYGDDLFLVNASFSSKEVSAPRCTHLLKAGSGYANLGHGGRQVAFRVFHPAESVPLQVEFAGAAKRASVNFSFKPNAGKPVSWSVPVELQDSGTNSSGEGNWQVPSVFGPAELDMTVTVDGREAYTRTVQIAIAKDLNLANISNSTFGVHLSSSGYLNLSDEYAYLWGAKWARVFLRWDFIEQQTGHYDWSKIDQLIELYKAQNMRVLAVMGEIPPRWLTQLGAPFELAYQKFVQAAMEHFRGKIEYWDVYNEIDSKYYAGIGFDKHDPNADIRVLQEQLQSMTREDPAAKKVCCSAGGSWWLPYSKRVFEAKLLDAIDVVSLHPYQLGAPEQKEGAFNYVESVAAIRKLIQSYGLDKPIWSTEANWFIGRPTSEGGPPPDFEEHTQAEYLVRVNLLSMAMDVPYFVHMPYYTQFHRELMLDSLASCANMAATFANVRSVRMLSLPDGIYGVWGQARQGAVGALWTTSAARKVRISGLSGLRVEDFYGNWVSSGTPSVLLSGSPIYFFGKDVPLIVAVRDVAASQRRTSVPLPDVRTWVRQPGSQITKQADGLHIKSRRTDSDFQVFSPKFPVAPNSCYLIRVQLTMQHGGLGVIIISGAETSRHLGNAAYLYTATGKDEYNAEVRINTGNETALQIGIQAVNPNGADVTEVTLRDAQAVPCT